MESLQKKIINNIYEKGKKFGLYLEIKVSQNSVGYYDKSKIEYTLKTIIKEGNYYIIIVNRPNIILKVNNHNEILQENGENLLFHIRIINDGYYLENPFLNINNTTEDNINNLNYKLWYVIIIIKIYKISIIYVKMILLGLEISNYCLKKLI